MNKRLAKGVPCLFGWHLGGGRKEDSTRVDEPVSYSGNGFLVGLAVVFVVFAVKYIGGVWGPGPPRPVLPPRSTYAQYDHDEGGDGEETDTE